MQYQYFYTLFHNEKAFVHQKIKSIGLSHTEYMICLFLFKHQVLSQQEVSDTLAIDKTTLSRAFASLEKKGFVKRNINDQNRRSNLPVLTEKGNEWIRRTADLNEQWMTKISESLTIEEKNQFENLCQRLLKASEKIAKEASSWNTNKSN